MLSICKYSVIIQLILGNLKYSNFEWFEDCVKINLHSDKEHKEGTGIHDRHVYANPIDCKISVLFALGMHVITANGCNDSGRVFESSNEEKIFSDWLKDVIKNFFPNDPDLIGVGVHSEKKGVGSYLSGGSTAGPSSATIELRLGNMYIYIL